MTCEIRGFAQPRCMTHGDSVNLRCTAEENKYKALVEKLAKVTPKDFAAFGVQAFSGLVNEAKALTSDRKETV